MAPMRSAKTVEAFQQTVTTACHHCVDPGCLNGCPVEAYEKDPATGIVRHLDDQCIGCQYCLWTCPYEVPKYSEARGIVRKCDMCHSRLAAEEAPACVQACPNGAIAIMVVKQEHVRERYRSSRREPVQNAAGEQRGKGTEGNPALSGASPFPLFPSAPVPRHDQNLSRLAGSTATDAFLPDSPEPHITLPTTRYQTSRVQPPNMRAGDHFKIKPQQTHWPLIFMLLLTQLSVGMFASDFVVRWLRPDTLTMTMSRWIPLIALGVGTAGLMASILHLGRPLQAWRSFLGWRTSWLSREVIAFGLFASAATASAGWNWLHPDSTAAVSFTLSAATVLSGLGGVFCSAMVYASTPREFWRLSHTGGRFFGSVSVLGTAAFFTVATLFQLPSSLPRAAAVALMLATAVKLAVELRFLRDVIVDVNDPWWTSLQRSVLLLQGPLGSLARGRQLFAVIGGVFLPLFSLLGASSPAIPLAVFAVSLSAESIERYLFFVAVAPAKMPGGS